MKYFTLFITIIIVGCAMSPNLQKQLSSNHALSLRGLNEKRVVDFYLDTSYKVAISGLEKWASNNTAKFKAKNEIIIKLYDYSNFKVDNIREEIKLTSKNEINNLYIDNLSIKDSTFINFNDKLGYKIIALNDKIFIQSYSVIDEKNKVKIVVTMKGEDWKRKDSTVFHDLISSFQTQ